MKEDESEGEEVPMMHLVSFALHKLFTEWQSDGFEIPDFKTSGNSAASVTDTNGKLDAPVKKAAPERSELPPNASLMHPSMLLLLVSDVKRLKPCR